MSTITRVFCVYILTIIWLHCTCIIISSLLQSTFALHILLLRTLLCSHLMPLNGRKGGGPAMQCHIFAMVLAITLHQESARALHFVLPRLLEHVIPAFCNINFVLHHTCSSNNNNHFFSPSKPNATHFQANSLTKPPNSLNFIT